MDFRVGVIALLVLASILGCYARNIEPSEVSDLENAGGPIDICTLCEDYTKLALIYLSQDKTQTQIMESLDKACLGLHGLEVQCTMMVKHYLPMLFSEVSSIKPDGFCKKVGLCKVAMVSQPLEKSTPCDLCHTAMDEALAKLKDPETELDAIQTLLKACDAVGAYAMKCKSMVFAFGPTILVDAGKFIEKNIDLCNTFHACHRQIVDAQLESVEGKIEMVTSS